MWASWSDFFAMGGYGLYVWGSYGVTLVVIALELSALRRRRRHALQSIRIAGTGHDGGAR
jgi:heme exporter protein D